MVESLNIMIKGEQIKQVSDVKYPGIILYSKLKFDKHTKKICRTVKASLICFKLIRNPVILHFCFYTQ